MICKGLGELKWHAWADSNRRPLVPEFSGKCISCWFALLSATAWYMVFLAVGLLLFRNCSEILASHRTPNKKLLRVLSSKERGPQGI